MEEKRTGKTYPGQIDVPILWILVRASQILLAVVLAKQVYLARGTESFVETAISEAGLLLMVFLLLHRVVTGRADAVGIHYRRYLRWRTLPRAGVQQIQWKSFRLRILVKGKRRPKAILEFLMNPVRWTGPYWAQRLGADVAPPEILERIRALPAETPPVTSAPPYARWFVRLFVSVGILFVVVVLIRLLLASSGEHH